jgi:hypothetical protein
VPLVPSLHCWSVLGLEEDAADASDTFHMTFDPVMVRGMFLRQD